LGKGHSRPRKECEQKWVSDAAGDWVWLQSWVWKGKRWKTLRDALEDALALNTGEPMKDFKVGE
jgi:hypothetical protein